jgi:hypothetical protein
MAFDIAPVPVRRPASRGPVIAVVALGLGIVTFAVATAGSAAPPGGVAPAVAGGAPGPVAHAPATPSTRSAPPASTASPATVPLRLPARIECHAVDPSTCDRLARATIGILPASGLRVSGIDAWASLLCGDAVDCPPDRLNGALLMGSTVVSFETPGTRAWVNVIEPAPTRGREWAPAQAVAWIVRWLP